MFRNGGDIVCYIFSVLGDTFCFELLKLPVTLQQIYDWLDWKLGTDVQKELSICVLK